MEKIKHKKNYVKVVLLILVIGLLLSACGKSSEDSMSYNNQNNLISDESNSTENNILNNDGTEHNDETENESTIPLRITLDSEGFVPLNSDGIIPLSFYSETAGSLGACSRDSDSNKICLVFYKNTNEIVPKIKRDADIGVYENEEEITLYSLEGIAPRYTIPLNFDYIIDDEVNDRPEFFPHENASWVNGYDHQKLEECNGEEFKTYVSSRCNIFHCTSYASIGSGFKLLDAEKNEEFTFGYYDETSWMEFSVKAIVEYYEFYSKSAEISVPVEKTKNGYFKVNLQNLDAGLYYVSNYHSYIELV